MSYSDSTFVALDTALAARVKQSILAACHNVQTEAIAESSLQLHNARSRLAAQIIMAFAAGSGNNWVTVFQGIVGNNTTCLSDATTQAGGALTTANEAAACAAITDAHIDNAIAAAWNDFLVLV